MVIRRFSWLLIFGAAPLVACGKKPAPASPAAAVSSGETSSPGSSNPTRSGVDPDQAERERLERERLAREAADREELTRTLQLPVFFAYDRSDLNEESRQVLEAKTRALNAHPEIRLRIVGHTDDRGSDEYNQALGQRRAAAAHRYLVLRGVAPGRLDYVSQGESAGVCMESTEACWARNRRAEFEIVR